MSVEQMAIDAFHEARRLTERVESLATDLSQERNRISRLAVEVDRLSDRIHDLEDHR